MSRTSIRTEQDIEHIVLDACLYGKDYAARTHGLGMSTVYAYMQRYPEYTPLSRTQMERHARDEQAFFGSTRYIDPLQRHAYAVPPAEPTLHERIAHVQAKLTAQLAQR
jgi:hypothetical protein